MKFCKAFLQTGEKPFLCPHRGCNKSFTEKGNLKTHIRIHTGERPYACTYSGCEKKFTTQGHLKDHMRRHTNERPFVCEVCQDCFQRASTLKIHRRRHTGEKPYICPYPKCEKAFSERGNLNTHMKTHVKIKINPRQEKEEQKKLMGNIKSLKENISYEKESKNEVFCINDTKVNSINFN